MDKIKERNKNIYKRWNAVIKNFVDEYSVNLLELFGLCRITTNLSFEALISDMELEE